MPLRIDMHRSGFHDVFQALKKTRQAPHPVSSRGPVLTFSISVTGGSLPALGQIAGWTGARRAVLSGHIPRSLKARRTRSGPDEEYYIPDVHYPLMADREEDDTIEVDESGPKKGKRRLHDLIEEFEREKENEMRMLRQEYEAMIREMSFKVRNLERRTDEYQEKVSTLEKMIEKIRQPPLISGYVVRLRGEDVSEGDVVIARGNDLLKVNVGPVDKGSLRLGQYVWVHPQTYSIIEVSERRHTGVVAKVFDVLKEMDRIIISTEDGMEKRVIPCPEGMMDELKPGFQISVLPPMMDVLEVLPNFEVKNLLLGERPNVRYSQVGGLFDAIERIRDVIVLPFKEKELFAEVALEAPRGILLYGPPGCGKTLLAKAVATENDMAFFNISIADILSKWVGESERLVKELFRQAKEHTPAIIFFDEIEALFTTRGLLDTSGVHKNIISQILAEMDGIVSLNDVFVIGATNRPDMLDPALLRPGRFDEIIEIPRPDRKACAEIIDVYLKEALPVSKDLITSCGSKKRAIRHIRSYILDEIFAEDKWIEVKLEPDAEMGVKTVKRKDVVSGAIIRAIMTTAKKNYVKRVMRKKKRARKGDGLTLEDIARAIEEECKEHALTEYATFERRQKEIFRKVGPDPMVL